MRNVILLIAFAFVLAIVLCFDFWVLQEFVLTTKMVQANKDMIVLGLVAQLAFAISAGERMFD